MVGLQENLVALDKKADERDSDALFKKEKQQYLHKERLLVQREGLVVSISLLGVILVLLAIL